MQNAYLVYSLDYDTYSYSGITEKLEHVCLSEEIAKGKVSALLSGLSSQSLKDLKPYYVKVEVSH